jgi:putative endonuclease
MSEPNLQSDLDFAKPRVSPDFLEWSRAADTHAVGVLGENEATHFLEQSGYTIVARNWRYGRHEIDIIAEDPDKTLVFVEVKANRSHASGTAGGRVNGLKILRIQRVAERYCLKTQQGDRVMRFDVITLEPTANGMAIEHHRNAFLPPNSGYLGF